MMRIPAVVIGLVLVALSTAAQAKRVALVVGNSAYEHTPRLNNPRNDATDVAAVLKAFGFQVIEGFDLKKAVFEQKVRDFASALSDAEVGLFFYAGHGLQVSGRNYLVPVDAKLDDGASLDFEMIQLDLVHRTMERQTNTNILFLDACRDNPLRRNLARAMGTRSSEVGHGLAAVESGVGTLISFSTQPGNVAQDGTGRNSPFAGALVKDLIASKDDLSAILIDVRKDVMRQTQNKQVPWEHSSLTGRFYVDPSRQTSAVAKVEPERLDEAAQAWDRAKDATNVAVLEEFLARYKETFYAHLARARIEELKKPIAEAALTSIHMVAFDGKWLVNIVCPRTVDGIQAYWRSFFADVKNGVLQGQDGVKDMPLWLTLQGTIEQNGTASLNVRGLSGDTATTMGNAPIGSLYQYAVTARFEGPRGTGRREGGRECNFKFAKR